MTDIQRAMLGDKDAAEMLTESGTLLPCPFCGNLNVIFIYHDDDENKEFGFIYCTKCNFSSDTYTAKNALQKWNTRAPLLTPEQMDELERMERHGD